jgi:heme oxygenase (mycobilin-producing)
MFVAINYITCTAAYRERFESLFATRAKAIDQMPGFIKMHVLRPTDGCSDYLIVSHWDSEEQFKTWTQSEAFREGHKRGFADISQARKEGREAPLKSEFRTYKVIAE